MSGSNLTPCPRLTTDDLARVQGGMFPVRVGLWVLQHPTPMGRSDPDATAAAYAARAAEARAASERAAAGAQFQAWAAANPHLTNPNFQQASQLRTERLQNQLAGLTPLGECQLRRGRN
jgi:hypothetical protein